MHIHAGAPSAMTGGLVLLLLAGGCTEENPALRDLGGGDGAVRADRGPGGPDRGDEHDRGPAVPDRGAGREAGARDGAQGGRIDIFVKGDLSAVTFGDGLSGQTPTGYQIAMSRYQVLTSASDPNPKLCFDHGSKPAVADMHKDNLVGSCATKKLPTGQYTYGRTKVDWARYTVKGVSHVGSIPFSGNFTFFRAYSDTTYQGKSYKAGTGFMDFVGATTLRIPITTFPAPPVVPGSQFSLKNGEFFWTFAYKKALPIVQTDKRVHWARFHWKVKDAFRWADRALSGYKKGVWDVSPNLLASEQVKMYGVSGYHVTSSVD